MDDIWTTGKCARAPAVAVKAFLLFSVVSGCESTRESRPGYEVANELFQAPRGPVPLAEWSRALSMAYCSALERCRAPGLQAGFYEHEPCVPFFDYRFGEMLDVPARVAAGQLLWDAEVFGTCVTDIATQQCPEPYSTYIPCLDRLSVPTSDGECLFGPECGATDYCRKETDRAGVCVPRAQLGAPCNADSQCRADLICFSDGGCDDTHCGICTEPLGIGQDCDADGDDSGCRRDLSCRLKDGYDHTGTCVLPGPAREPGTIAAGKDCHEESSRDRCEPETRCIPTGFRRVGPTSPYQSCATLKEEGEACIRFDSAMGACDVHLYCDAASNEGKGKCRPRTEIGGACVPYGSDSCVLGSKCSAGSGKCVKGSHARLGEPCDDARACYSLNCLRAPDAEESAVCAPQYAP